MSELISTTQPAVIPPPRRTTFNPTKSGNVFNESVMTRNIQFHIGEIGGKNIKQMIETKVASIIEGKCIVEGFVKPGTTNVLEFSAGRVLGAEIAFEVVFEAMVCYPVEGLFIDCVVKSITKAGVRAELREIPTPMVIFIARDHNYGDEQFSKLQMNQQIQVKNKPIIP